MTTTAEKNASPKQCSRCERPICKCLVWAFARSDLPASGFTNTVTELHAWCGVQVHRIRQTFNHEMEAVSTTLRAYRHKKEQYLALDFWREKNEREQVVFLLWGENTYAETERDEIEIFDMVEAMHAIGIIVQALRLRTIEIGNITNETNEDVVGVAFKKEQTNGRIDLWQ